MTSLAPVKSPTNSARVVAVLVALFAGSFAQTSVSALLSARNHGETGEVIGAAIAIVGFTALALWQGWYAWRGWARPTETRVARVLRFASAGFVLWGLVATAVVIAVVTVATSRDAGMLPVFAWLSAPIGAIIGAVRALRNN